MKLTNILPSAHKASPENKCLKNMSELPYINKLLQKLDSLKNTNVKFEGQYVNFRSDIVKLSKNVLSLHYNAELTDLGIKDKPEQIKNEPAKTTLNERAKEWYQQERNTIPVAIIKREIDHVCAEKKIGLTSEEINRIVDIVNEKHIQNNMLAKDGATYSTMFSLKLDGELSKKINEYGIKDKLISNFTKSMPEFSTHLEKELKTNKLDKKYSEYKKQILEQHDNTIMKMQGKIKTDIYNTLTENIYNALLCNNETEQTLDFNAIKEETRAQALLITEEKIASLTTPPDKINIENIIHKSLDLNMKVTSEIQYTPSINNVSDKETDDLFNSIEKYMLKGNISDQRAYLGNKKV